MGIAAAVAIVFWIHSRQPLYHTDLWGHLAYGRLIWQTGAIPETEPFMPLARGVTLVDTAWLAQIAGYLAISQGGPPAIQMLHALSIAVCFAALARWLYVQTTSVVFTLAGMALFEALNWFQFRVVRPQMAGLACCAALLTVLTARRWRPVYWLAIPVTLALWANLHGSFVIGLGFLGTACLGRIIDVFRRTGHIMAPIHDRHSLRLLFAAALAAAAVLLNPYGPKLYAEVLAFSRHPNLDRLLEWQALSLRSVQGQIAAGVAAALVVVFPFSRRRVPAGEVLAVLGLGVATFWSTRTLVWWAPVATSCLVLNAHDAWRRLRPVQERSPTSHLSGSWRVVAAGLALLAFATTPFGLRLFAGRDEDLRSSVSAQTPVAATDWLVAHPSTGQLFNTYEWGDFLVWAGPPSLPVFVTSQAHLVPREVWEDYVTVISVAAGWEQILERYRVERVVVDKFKRGALIARLRTSAEWEIVFEDPVAVVFKRRDGLQLKLRAGERGA
jgi:hypothetical protein